MAINFQIKLKKKKKNVKKGRWTFYYPNTQNTELRVFFCLHEKTYERNLKENYLKEFDCCLAGVMVKVYGQRLKQFVS